MDEFKIAFKRYKQRKPPPDLSEVVDFQKPEKWKNMIQRVHLSSHDACGIDISSLGLKQCCDWKVYSLTGHPGFLYVVNPFCEGSQWRWAKKCVQEYSCKPNKSNLDAHHDIHGSIWDMSSKSDDLDDNIRSFQKSLFYKLRWVTLGYQYDWNTKTYSAEDWYEFPQDLAQLFSTIAKSLEFDGFSAEAGIINYYHLDSTLSGHTDHSELDLTAPLFSLSFGQSAIFLLGGKTRDVTPVALYMRSGDVMVMAGESRLAFHGVPRVLAPNPEERLPLCLLPSTSEHSSLESSTQEASQESKESTVSAHGRREERFEENNEILRRKRTKLDETIAEVDDDDTSLNESILTAKCETDLMKFYFESSRINVNVRQVVNQGDTFDKTEQSNK